MVYLISGFIEAQPHRRVDFIAMTKLFPVSIYIIPNHPTDQVRKKMSQFFNIKKFLYDPHHPHIARAVERGKSEF